jgi:hypothetical protein
MLAEGVVSAPKGGGAGAYLGGWMGAAWLPRPA